MNEALPRWRTFSSAHGRRSPVEPPSGDSRAVEPVRHREPLGGTRRRGSRRRGSRGSLGAGRPGLFRGPGAHSGERARSAHVGPVHGSGGTAARAGNGTVITQGPNDVVAYGTGSELVVDVAGAVQQPGLHRLRNGDRVADAIDAAGGYAARVDLAAAGSALNLAELLTDGAKVVVPELGMEAERSESRPTAASISTPLIRPPWSPSRVSARSRPATSWPHARRGVRPGR